MAAPSFLCVAVGYNFVSAYDFHCLTMDFYHLQLTGNVGSSTFNSRQVRSLLGQYPGKHVDVMIDSFGGSLPEGLSICGAIRDHGDVTVHFRGMSASAATIASMGAKRICIAPEAMYLVHKASMEFFDWASRNADELELFIEALKSAKDDLDAIDRSMAELYASRCKKKAKDLLELMKAERWLTAKEALDWGFVDEIDGVGSVEEPVLSRAQAAACRALGHPLPPVEVESDQRSFLRAVKEVVTDILNKFKPGFMDQNVIAEGAVATAPGCASAPAGAASAGGDAVAPAGAAPDAASSGAAPDTASAADVDALKARINALEEENARLRNCTPAAASGSVVAQPTAADQKRIDNSAFARFNRTSASARKLFDALP